MIMKFLHSFFRSATLVIALQAMVLGSGCNRAETAPPVVSLDQLPTLLEESFAKAESQTQTLARQTTANVRQREYSKAYIDLQTLSGRSGLTREQSRAVASALLTMNNTLQAAQSQGDVAAAQTLQQRRRDK